MSWFKGANDELIASVENGDLAAVRKLLATGANVNTRRRDGITALMSATDRGYLEIVKVLLEAKADVNAKADGIGITALILAAQEGFREIVQLLLNAGADVNVQMSNGVTALIMAAQEGHEGVVVELLKAQADVNIKAEDGGTALLVASESGHMGIARLLGGGTQKNIPRHQEVHRKLVMKDGRMYVDTWIPGEDPTGMFCPACDHKQEIDYRAFLTEGASCEACGQVVTRRDDVRIYPFRR